MAQHADFIDSFPCGLFQGSALVHRNDLCHPLSCAKSMHDCIQIPLAVEYQSDCALMRPPIPQIFEEKQ